MRISDWSSDVCSSDLLAALAAMLFAVVAILRGQRDSPQSAAPLAALGTPQRCAAYDGLPPDGGAHVGMQYIAGGRFELGSLRGYAAERPLVATEVAPFRSAGRRVGNAWSSKCRSRWATDH